MAIRDWSARRILGIWTGWMSALLITLLGAIVINPTGVTLRMAGAEAPVGVRVGIAVLGLVAVCLPPAILTYAWYLKRLRAWSNRSEGKQPGEAHVERLLSEGEARPLGHRAHERSGLGRPARHT